MFRVAFLAGLATCMAEDTDAAWYAEAEQSLGDSLKRDLEQVRELAQHGSNATTTTVTTNANYTATVEVKGSTTMKAKLVAACDTNTEMDSTACAALKSAYVSGVCAAITFLATGGTSTALTHKGTSYHVACTGNISVSARRALEEEQGAQSRELQTQKSLTITYIWKVPTLPAHGNEVKNLINTGLTNNWASSGLAKIKQFVESSLTTLANTGSALVCATCKTVSDVAGSKPSPTATGATTVESAAWRVISVALVAAVSTMVTFL